MKCEQIWTAIDKLAKISGMSLSNLAKKSGLDSTTFNKSTISRGRPSKVYRINLPGVPKGNE